jgi:hypothetical protein
MSPTFRKYTRPITTGRRERAFAIAEVSNIQSGKRSRSFKSFPIPLGYMTKREVENITFDEVQANLNTFKGQKATVDRIVGFLQVKPTKERVGIRFDKKGKSTANARKNNRSPRRGRF